MNVFGVILPTQSRSATLQAIARAAVNGPFCRITTLNPEFLLLAHADEAFRENLNRANIQTLDGTGLRLAFWRARQVWPGRVTGGELVERLARAAAKHHWRVGIVVREDGLSSLEEILAGFRKNFPGIDCVGVALPKATRSIESLQTKQLTTLQQSAIVLTGLGAPEQEYFNESLRVQSGSIRLAVGVGGVFDVISGKKKRPPRWMTVLGLEWLWRLLQQPRRVRRIARAVVLFPWRVLTRQ